MIVFKVTLKIVCIIPTVEPRYLNPPVDQDKGLRSRACKIMKLALNLFFNVLYNTLKYIGSVIYFRVVVEFSRCLTKPRSKSFSFCPVVVYKDCSL